VIFDPDGAPHCRSRSCTTSRPAPSASRSGPRQHHGHGGSTARCCWKTACTPERLRGASRKPITRHPGFESAPHSPSLNGRKIGRHPSAGLAGEGWRGGIGGRWWTGRRLRVIGEDISASRRRGCMASCRGHRVSLRCCRKSFYGLLALAITDMLAGCFTALCHGRDPDFLETRARPILLGRGTWVELSLTWLTMIGAAMRNCKTAFISPCMC